MYYVYIVRCTDNSLYTGIAANWQRRIAEHIYQGKKCAKYTKSHKVKQIAALWSVEDKSAALKIEKKIKSLTKHRKEKLIESGSFDSVIFDGIEAEYIKNASMEECINKQQ